MPLDLGRVQKEIKDIDRDKASGVTVEIKGHSVQHLLGCLPGPRDTPYQDGTFYVDIELDDQYPFVPPKMRFITKVWHPNISSANGAICLDILKDQWSPALTLKTALLSLQALLASPQPDDPQDAVVARQYLGSYQEFQATAKQWADAYAHRNQVVSRGDKLRRIVEMGFPEEEASRALEKTNGDEQAAMDMLLGG